MINIRKATKDDIEIFYELLIGIAKHHNQEQYVLTNKEELLKSGFYESPKFGVLLAEYDGIVAGYVSYTKSYSIWLGSDYLNIDDVFVLDKYRGQKLGELLMNGVKEMCKEEGIHSVKWEVESDNIGAIRFYERLGATLNTKGIFKWNLG